ncbi:amidohydrolase family protein [Devosia sp. YIM 151766]|uniref:metal-dependent hydrolase family protein n=1 Tax=Devosia sp. YIM 151766 TaxID=3017325 RepID=UPI00255C290A|nr:amidohydrolase family protein [Devosia sp. YIM 151766]WIY52722.1 amidohydrolase family protein [Devosia sp. YIM 151766]
MTATIFTNASVFDGLGDEAVPGMNVLVVDGRIEAVSEQPITSSEAVTYDVGGRTLLPGLIDAHAHVFAINLVEEHNREIPLTEMTAQAVPRIRKMLDRGFTSVRDVAGGDVGIRRAIAQGYIPGPRLFVGGPALSQIGGHGDHRSTTDERLNIDINASAFNFICRIVEGEANLRSVVRNELRKGADHIKVLASGGVGSPNDAIEATQFTEGEIRAVVEEARIRGKYVCAHAYESAAIAHSIRAGVRCIEHGNLINSEVAAMVAGAGAYIVPTLVAYEVTAQHGERLGLSEYVMQKLNMVNDAGIAMLGLCEDAGVKLGFGTDLMGEMEFAQLQEFTIRGRVQRPVDILKSATSVNAEIVQRPDLGVISPGAIADVIIVDGDPLKDISILTEPEKNLRLIMKDGQVYKTDLTPN